MNTKNNISRQLAVYKTAKKLIELVDSALSKEQNELTTKKLSALQEDMDVVLRRMFWKLLNKRDTPCVVNHDRVTENLAVNLVISFLWGYTAKETKKILDKFVKE